MKGVIFNLAEEVIVDTHGEDAWDALLDAAGVDGAYTSLGNYPDDDLVRLVEAAPKVLGVSSDTFVARIGEGALPLLADRYPVFFEGHDATRAFLLTLNDVIHSEVRKLYPGADVPEFGFEETDSGELVMTYRSPRKLCALARGFIAGSAQYYGEVAVIDQALCMHRGDDRCELRCRFTKAAA